MERQRIGEISIKILEGAIQYIPTREALSIILAESREFKLSDLEIEEYVKELFREWNDLNFVLNLLEEVKKEPLKDKQEIF